jgi:hypothetical protein
VNPLITKLALALIGGLLYTTVSAQSPALINYQAVARSASTGAELSNQSLYLILKVRSGSPAGNIVYQEEHLNAATNEFGLFNIQIGAGNPMNGNFSTLNWGMGPYWLEIDMDAGSGLETLGSMQFVSVPYALHARTVDNVDDDDADPTNELITNFSLQDNHSLSIIEGANVHSVDLSGLVNQEDVDPANELITDFSLVDGNMLSINEGPNTHQVDLSGLTNTEDIDPANELITDFSLIDGNTLSISEGPNTYQVDLSGLTNTDDVDPTNELQTLAEVISYSVPPGSAGAQRIRDLSDPVNSQDAATKSYVDNFALAGDLDQTLENPSVVGLRNRPISSAAPVNGQVLVYNQFTNTWQPQTLAPNPILGEQFYSFDISAFTEAKKDGDADKTNIAIYQEELLYLTIHKGDLGNLFFAPIHLLDGAKMTEIKVSFKKLQAEHNLRCRIRRITPATGATILVTNWISTFIGTSSAIQTHTIDLTTANELLRTVDNSQYTYRLELVFEIESASYNDIEDVRLMFYGANLKYSY